MKLSVKWIVWKLTKYLKGIKVEEPSGQEDQISVSCCVGKVVPAFGVFVQNPIELEKVSCPQLQNIACPDPMLQRQERVWTGQKCFILLGVGGGSDGSVLGRGEAMSQIDVWGVDLFNITQCSQNQPLTATSYFILRKRGLIQAFQLDPVCVVKYLRLIERHYPSTNPYHNSTHAADVAQSIHVLLSSPTLTNMFTELEQLAAILAAAVHDVDHPGFTNQFMINSGSPLALMYNDESVLEQHHLGVAFRLLQTDGCDPFTHWPKHRIQNLRKIVMDMVLSTDMSEHSNLLTDLKTMVKTKKRVADGSGPVLLDNYDDRIRVLQSMIHLADLSNPTKPIEVYRKWNGRVMEEHWLQGDNERKLGMNISPMCDRHNTSIEKTQIGFIDYIVRPLWETWADLVHPDAQEILNQLKENREWYQARLPSVSNPAMVWCNADNGSDGNTAAQESTAQDSNSDVSSWPKAPNWLSPSKNASHVCLNRLESVQNGHQSNKPNS